MSRLDLLLVNAPSRLGVYGKLADISACEPPVWAGLIARYCMIRGFNVEILDAEAEGLSVEQTAQRISDINPKLAVFCVYGHQPSASTQCMPGAIAVAEMVTPSIQMMVIGTHPSALPERTLIEGPFDFVCQGEGPLSVEALLRSVGGEFTRGKIPGVWFRGDPGDILHNDPAPNITDLDATIPRQAWQLLEMGRYRAHNWHLWTGHPAGGYASVQTSLGCPFRCTFCCINAPFTAGGDAPKLRKWSAQIVADQIDELINGYGITNIKIPDEMFVLDKNHVTEICELLIEKHINQHLNMWAYARIDTVRDPKMLSLMRKAGFRWLGIGIESGSAHVRDGVEKGRFGQDDIRVAVKRVRDADIAVAANYIFGLPDDTVESMQQTLDLACELNTEWANFYCAMAYPGSQLYRDAIANGWRLPDSWIGYSQHAYESTPLPTATLTSEQVLDFRDDAFLTYFGRPEYQEMIDKLFFGTAKKDVQNMVARGKPARRHRDPK